MDDKTIQGIANADTTSLGITDDGFAHLQVALFVEIGIDNTCTRLNDWYAGSIANKVDKASSTTRNTQVDIAYGIEHLASSFMGGRQQSDDIWIDAKLFQYLMNEFYRGLIGEVSIRATFQYTGITALEAQRENIEGDVRTSLIDHADHTKRYADTMQTQTVG